MIIESVDNKYIKSIINNKDIFLVEGEHLVQEAYETNYLLEILLLENEETNINIKTTYINQKVMNKLSKLESKTKIIGICRKIDNNKIFSDKILMLDNIQDPSNLGMLIRSAVAFSYNTIILSNTSVKYTNEKVIRASQGMIFKVNIIYDDLENIIQELKKENYEIYGTDVNEGKNIKDFKKNNKHVIILGNEGKGINSNLYKYFDKTINIKINKNCESLNVAVAGSIIMYNLN
ncbi:MAG TPA: RNA methyltransferase [Bacilli bacterium]|nr:RNA methyltransferase [Bacilli bacterium]